MTAVIRGFVVLSVLTLAGVAQAQTYECSGFAEVEEYRSTIDMQTEKADFFDNDTTSDLELVYQSNEDTVPRQTRYVFEGPDASAPNGDKLRLLFDLPSQYAFLYTVEADGHVKSIGHTKCEQR